MEQEYSWLTNEARGKVTCNFFYQKSGNPDKGRMSAFSVEASFVLAHESDSSVVRSF